ncbi:hypothetical protein MJO28_008834 [Puccinia striiformis f. sp. tritici]|uniref:Uncharacterized protein n=1 Tax=Puccinia striiformis f. sp. tritici TaxID=168172 RepID=A0ACC0ECX0_9BASI|nr:hypothetical protein MJO28_008834 [Puccinia striiformis f. sp. tritici]
MLLHVLEKRFSGMKAQAEEKKKALLKKMEAGGLNEEEEEWLDNEGNFVDEFLLMEKLKAIAPNNQHIPISASDIQIIQKISLFETEHTQGKKDALPSTQKKTLPAAPLEKKKKTATVSSPKKKQSVKQKLNLKSESKSSKKPIRATMAQKIEVLDWYDKNGKNQTKTAKHFNEIYPEIGFKQPLISAWVADCDRIREQADSSASHYKRVRITKFPQIEEMLDQWVTQALHSKLTITGDVIRAKWHEFASMEKIPSEEWLNLSQGWLTRFKARHGLQSFTKHGEAAQADKEVIDEERKRVSELVQGFARKDIWNMDETGLFYSMPPDRGLAKEKCSGLKASKTRITIAVTTNSDGSEKLPLLIIGKWAKPKAFKKKSGLSLGFDYHFNKRAWMTTEIFHDWIGRFNCEMRSQKRNILLLVDNFSAHSLPEGGLSNIRLELFSPNLTAHIQPMDAGIIKAFKSHYKQRFISKSIQRYNQGTPITSVYNIDQLAAMHLSRLAWQCVSETTIRNCWNHTGIFPGQLTRFDGTENDRALEKQIDRLQSMGLLHATNRMSIAELLNPADESGYSIWTSEEIFRSVKDSRTEDDDQDDDNNSEPPPPPKPTAKEVFKAISLINNYIESDTSVAADKLNQSMETYSKSLLDHLITTAQQSTITSFFPPADSS